MEYNFEKGDITMTIYVVMNNNNEYLCQGGVGSMHLTTNFKNCAQFKSRRPATARVNALNQQGKDFRVVEYELNYSVSETYGSQYLK